MEEAQDGVGGGWALGIQKVLGPQVGGWLSACPQGRGTWRAEQRSGGGVQHPDCVYTRGPEEASRACLGPSL